VPTDAELRGMIIRALPGDGALTPLRGLRMDLSANRGFRKVMFSVRCDCGTAAVLSIEVAEHKTEQEVEEALPVLIDRLVGQTEAFKRMSCDVHVKMGLGPAASSRLGR